MKIPTPSIPLPEVAIGEWSAFDTRTAVGLFAYRHSAAMSLLDLPDVGGGDIDAQGRRDALRNAVAFMKPLASVSLFLGVVALEDYIRDLAARLADTPACRSKFPEIASLRTQPIVRAHDQMFKRLDTDPAGIGTVDPDEINKAFKKALGVEPVPVEEAWHLRDLALLRHTVAHYGGVIRQVDLPRFGHFIVVPGRAINPPPDFVKDELTYLFRLGREIERRIKSAIFGAFISAAGAGWSQNPPKEIEELIELFGYFGHIESTQVAVGYSEAGSELRRRQESEAARIRTLLIQRCIGDLTAEFGA